MPITNLDVMRTVKSSVWGEDYKQEELSMNLPSIERRVVQLENRLNELNDFLSKYNFHLIQESKDYSLQELAGIFSSGKNIFIPPSVTMGILSGNISITNKISITGGGAISFKGDFTQHNMFLITGNEVEINNIRFINESNTYPLQNNSNGFLKVSGNGFSMTRCSMSDGLINMENSKYSSISNNHFINSMIVTTGEVDECDIVRNIFDLPSDKSKYSVFRPAIESINPVKSINIDSNIIKNVYSTGIKVGRTQCGNISNNKIYTPEVSSYTDPIIGIISESKNCKIFSNNIYLNTNINTNKTGIKILTGEYSGKNLDIEKNIIEYGNINKDSDKGIEVVYSDPHKLYNTLIQYNYISNIKNSIVLDTNKNEYCIIATNFKL